MVSDKVFTNLGTAKIFQSGFNVISEDHIRVFLDGVVVSKGDYDLINNAAVFHVAPVGTSLVLQVGTTPDDILTSPTDIGVVISNLNEILLADDNATIATTQAGIATTQADIATTQAGIATTQAGIATTQAGIATTQASEASQSATDANTSAQNALLSANNASTSESNAEASALSASSDATTATEQAGIATAQAAIATDKATIAIAQAGSASVSALDASNSAIAASNSATNASDQAIIAEGYASDAESARDTILNMTAVTGAEGTEVIWDNINGILTVPRGDTGVQGIQGIQGIQGETGNGIDNIAWTSNSAGHPQNTAGTIDTYTITYTDATTATFTVYNGANGAGVGDFLADGTVPMTGTLNMNSNNIDSANMIYTSGIQINTEFTGSQGIMTWNADDETLDLIRNGSTLQLGQEVQIHCTKHGSVADIPDGVPVIAMGTVGGSGKILIGEATLSNWQLIDAGATEVPAKQVIGVATEAITNNGSVTCFGKVNDVSGANYTQGAIYYVDTANGGLTATKPTSGLVMPIAFAINSNTIMVRTTPINELDIEQGVEAYTWGDHSTEGYLLPTDIGSTVQGYDANTVVDSAYVHTDNNYTTTEKNKLAGIETGATADQTASEILTLVKTVDGSGSGLDADTVDGCNVSTSTSLGTSNTLIPTQNAVKAYVDANAGYTETNNLASAVTWTDVPDAYKNTNTVYALSGTTPAINPDNGVVQTWGLTGNSTPTDSLASGQMVELHIDDGSGYTITWTMVDEWIGGSAPTLDTTNTSVVFLEKIGSTVIGRDGGVAS